jgi:hypothetical protein
MSSVVGASSAAAADAAADAGEHADDAEAHAADADGAAERVGTVEQRRDELRSDDRDAAAGVDVGLAQVLAAGHRTHEDP